MTTDREIEAYIQGKLDRMHRENLAKRQVASVLRQLVKKKKPTHINFWHYRRLVNQVLKRNGYTK